MDIEEQTKCKLILQIFNLIFLLGHLSQNIPNGHLLGQKLVRNDRNAGEGPRVTRPGVQLVCFEVIHTGGGWQGGLASPREPPRLQAWWVARCHRSRLFISYQLSVNQSIRSIYLKYSSVCQDMLIWPGLDVDMASKSRSRVASQFPLSSPT